MKVLYVGDNRTRLNWGCRATSIALQHLIEANNIVISKISEKEAHNNFTPTIFGGFIPKIIIRVLLLNKKKKLSKLGLTIFKATGGRVDYVSDDVDKSVIFILKYGYRYPHLREILKSIEECDSIIINGEGSFIYCTPSRRELVFYLIVLKIGQSLGKKTVIVNAMFSNGSNSIQNELLVKRSLPLLKACQTISVRDMESEKYLNEMGLRNNVSYHPDALFTWVRYFKDGLIVPKIGDAIIPFPEEDKYFNKFDFNNPYMLLGGSSVAQLSERGSLIYGYRRLLDKLKELNIKIYLVQTCAGDEFLNEVSRITEIPIIPVKTSIIQGTAILANARLFISGRFHPSIMASLGGTPCIFLKSNSHKTRSLQEVLEYDQIIEYSVVPDEKDIETIFNHTKHIVKEGEALRKKIKKVALNRGFEAEQIKLIL